MASGTPEGKGSVCKENAPEMDLGVGHFSPLAPLH